MASYAGPARQWMAKLREMDKRVAKRLDFSHNPVSTAIHGKKAFLPPISTVRLTYDNPRLGGGGDSKGMISFVTTELESLARSRPYVAFQVAFAKGPPRIEAVYTSGISRQISVSRQSPPEIRKALEHLMNTRGVLQQQRLSRGPVIPFQPGTGASQSVDAPWSPFHSKVMFKP